MERGTKPDAVGRKPCHWTNTWQAAMANASRAWQYTQTRCMTFVQWQTTVSIDNTISTSRRSCHSPRWQSLRFVGSPPRHGRRYRSRPSCAPHTAESATARCSPRPGRWHNAQAPPLVEQQTPFPADNPAMIRKACAADLSRAPTLPNGVDQLHARGINDAQPRRGGQEGLRPGLRGPEEAKEPGPCR